MEEEGGSTVVATPDEVAAPEEVTVPIATAAPEPEDVKPTIDPPDLSKDPALLHQAQEDIKQIDVLVCGKCHEVCYFVEELQLHKLDSCNGVSKVRAACDSEPKPQVWGFTLWKNKENNPNEDPVPTSWELYQRWCKLDQTEKDLWITAGQTLQFCNKIYSAKVSAFTVTKDEKDPLAIDDGVKKSVGRPVKVKQELKPNAKNGGTNMAYRTLQENEKQEYVVEKIVSKRFNPRRKTFEYQIKWENFESDANTWEPVANLTSCKAMVDEFDEELKKQKAEKAKLTPTGSVGRGRGRGRGRPVISHSSLASSPSTGSFLGDLTPGRPQRTSKQKALNQVKAWCGNISDTDEGGVKRPHDDDDSDDSFEKKMKYEEYSDDESDTDIKPALALKKVLKPTILNNGIGSKMPQNVLIPDANGVVRINQKQLPSLSTGVYIMSKTAGIIKLDSTTSKVATSGGQTIVKVAPKIGQTQIKIVKKDGATTSKIIQMSPAKPLTGPTKTFKPIITKVKKAEEKSEKPKLILKPKEDENFSFKFPEPEESDDGLEELEFPKELTVPEPDSPPTDFVLDPITGKIAGRDYSQEKPVEINIKQTESKDVSEENNLSSANSLENIVKLAAADITEDDLKVDPLVEDNQTNTLCLTTSNEVAASSTKIFYTSTSSPATVGSANKTVMSARVQSVTSSKESILNKALTNSNILHKSLTTRPKVAPRILNQSAASRPSTSVNPLIRSNIATVTRTKPQAPKPRFNISASPAKFHETPARNVYSKSTNVARKVGNTTMYKTSPPIVRAQPRIIQSNVYKTTTRKEPLVSPKKKSVINMPSLIGDDDSAVATAALAATTAATPPAESIVATTSADTTDLSTFTLTDGDNPLFITGDDGTVYQVAGQNEQGQTILITQGSDGQQQCLLVTNEATTEETSQVEMEVEEPVAATATTSVEEPLNIKTDIDPADQVVAQVVRAEPPSPGGTHKVVVMLPDGNLMVTQVTPEEYARLELE